MNNITVTRGGYFHQLQKLDKLNPVYFMNEKGCLFQCAWAAYESKKHLIGETVKGLTVRSAPEFNELEKREEIKPLPLSFDSSLFDCAVFYCLKECQLGLNDYERSMLESAQSEEFKSISENMYANEWSLLDWKDINLFSTRELNDLARNAIHYWKKEVPDEQKEDSF